MMAQRLFVASCMSIGTAAMVFAIRGDVAGPMSATFHLTSALAALTAATIFGIGKTFLWPTMIGVTAELFPRGGPLLLAVMGGAGMLSVGLVLPVMGARMDQYGPGAALQMVAVLGAILTLVFAGVWLRFRAHGGYRAVRISDSRVPTA
jgi:hypothetical protein